MLRPMRAIRWQYFLTFAVMGSLMPYAPVYFKQQHLNETLIGYIMAASSVAIVLSPVLITLLADTHLDARRLMAGMFLVGAVGLVAMPALHAFWPILLLWLFYNMMSVSLNPLQDGINFSVQEQRRLNGLPAEAYHRVRVWGTVGFIVPSIAVYLAMRRGVSVSVSWNVAAVFSVLGAINALLLPDPRLHMKRDPISVMPDRVRLPTLEAARALLRPPLLVFCVALFLLNMASVPYYTFYSIYLTDRVYLDPRWIGPINNVGPVFEILFMLAFGYLLRHIGLRWILLGGLAISALRAAMLAPLAGGRGGGRHTGGAWGAGAGVAGGAAGVRQ